MISETEIIKLNALPLEQVMRNNGYEPHHRTSKSYFYICPFHKEKNGSFCVSKYPAKGQQFAAFWCFACSAETDAKGVGAIMLQQKLLERDGEKADFISVVNRLAKDFNLELDGDYKNGFFHRSKKVEPIDKVAFDVPDREFTVQELRALGCRVEQSFYADEEKDDTWMAERKPDGSPAYRYSFVPAFYENEREAENFDSNILKKMFGLYPLDGYVTPAKENEEEVKVSYEVKATQSYPMFLFRYTDKNGKWWARKYEPYFRESEGKGGRKGANYKFTWWFQDGKCLPTMKRDLYGDADVMSALDGAEVMSSDDAHPVMTVQRSVAGKRQAVRVFHRIVICSGPRDAINVYFHSNAHVVYPHSEGSILSSACVKKLREIAAEVFVLYDIDSVGMSMMNRIALKYPELKAVYLPDDLATQYNPRSGKLCKDAEEFFNFYPNVMRANERLAHTSINARFDALLTTAKRMRFWDVQYQSKKDEFGERYDTRKYTLNFSNLAQFLSANGFYVYTDESRTDKFVIVQNNIVDVVEENKSLTAAKAIMHDWLELNPQYYNEDLANAVFTQKKIGVDTLNSIRHIKLDFVSWGKDFEYFFFRNTAVKVTKDAIEAVNYKDLPFQVNREAIMDADYHALPYSLFTIEENPSFAARKADHEQALADKKMSLEDKECETAEFIGYERMYRYFLHFTNPIEQSPIAVQYLYDTCRIHWKKEDKGLPLTAEEKQRQDMHFVCKCAMLGYMLSRYRTGAMQQMGVVTDYTVVDENKSAGGTGKSIIRGFLEMVRKVCYIGGKSFKRGDNMAKNFAEFRDTVDSLIFIDDLRSDLVGDEFYNATDKITVKTLYKDEATLPDNRTPKILATMNKFPFDMSSDSTYRRMYLAMQSDFYHSSNYSGTVEAVTPQTRFGKDIIKEITSQERDEAVALMLQCCQFYLGIQRNLTPPMERDGQMRLLYSSIKDASFIAWANGFFANPWHKGRPLDVYEICASYLEEMGEEVTQTSIKKSRNDVLKKLRAYCTATQIAMNPAIVFRGDTSSGSCPRAYAWTKDWMTNEMHRPDRVRRNVRCCYFYSLNEVPKIEKEILPCPENDEEMEWKRKTEIANVSKAKEEE